MHDTITPPVTPQAPKGRKFKKTIVITVMAVLVLTLSRGGCCGHHPARPGARCNWSGAGSAQFNAGAAQCITVNTQFHSGAAQWATGRVSRWCLVWNLRSKRLVRDIDH